MEQLLQQFIFHYTYKNENVFSNNLTVIWENTLFLFDTKTFFVNLLCSTIYFNYEKNYYISVIIKSFSSLKVVSEIAFPFFVCENQAKKFFTTSVQSQASY